MNERKKKLDRNVIMKVSVVLIIGLVIMGIYFFKKVEESKKSEVVDQLTTNSVGQLPLEIAYVNLEEIKSYGVPFVINLGSESCYPCQRMAPIIETMYSEFKGRVIVHFVDVGKNPSVAQDFSITLIPSQVFYNADGTPYVPSEELSKEIDFTLYRSDANKEHLFTVHQGGLSEEQMKIIFAEMGVE